MSDEQWRRQPEYGATPPPPGLPYQQPWPPAPGWWTAPPQYQTSPPPPPRNSRRRTVGIAAAIAAVVLATGASVVAFDGNNGSHDQVSAFSPNGLSNPSSGSSGQTQTPQTQTPEFGGGSQTPQSGDGSSGLGGLGDGSGSSPSTGLGGSGSSGDSGGSSSGGTSTGKATTAQQVGVVDINTVLNYGQEEAAGTGIVLTSNGEILTNNHVVNESTSISVTIVSTGKTYTASVVGTDPTDDVAVIKLNGASGLSTAKLGDSSKVAVGDAVTAVGNAGGTGGVPSSASGSVTALGQTLTATDEGGSNPETLHGMFEINADIQPGDSGGPLYASNGTIIGIDTAASTSANSVTTAGYAIPLAKALSVVKQIDSGSASSTIHLGSSGFLGVEVSSNTSQLGGSATSGAEIEGVIDNSGAAAAGIAQGDTITAVNGKTIASPSDLTAAMANSKPGQKVNVTWVDSNGQSHSASVTLGSGPAD